MLRLNPMHNFPEIVREMGHGGIAKLVRSSGLSRNTLEKAARGEDIGAKAAKALASVLDGKVSAAQLAGLV